MVQLKLKNVSDSYHSGYLFFVCLALMKLILISYFGVLMLDRSHDKTLME